MKQIQKFFNDIATKRIKYAFAVRLMYTFDSSKVKVLRRFSERCWDYAYLTDMNQCADTREYVEDKVEATPCGCTTCACWQCGSYPICGEGGVGR